MTFDWLTSWVPGKWTEATPIYDRLAFERSKWVESACRLVARESDFNPCAEIPEPDLAIAPDGYAFWTRRRPSPPPAGEMIINRDTEPVLWNGWDPTSLYIDEPNTVVRHWNGWPIHMPTQSEGTHRFREPK